MKSVEIANNKKLPMKLTMMLSKKFTPEKARTKKKIIVNSLEDIIRKVKNRQVNMN